MLFPEPILYDIKPTALIPNSLNPLLLYKGVFLKDGKVDAVRALDTFRSNGWDVQWVTRYGRQQRSHYHAYTHEMMIVLSGPGIIRWGSADLSDDPEEHTYGDAYEKSGVEVEVEPGDVFVIPAGVAHKSYNPQAEGEAFGVLTGSARGIESFKPREKVAELPLHGFMMMGAYPVGNSWNWGEGGDDIGNYHKIWNIPNPKFDPLVGANGGIHKYWKQQTYESKL
ncbi:unnamed protein product [Clonostachys byssicola]|uniref:Cupin type-1 domain-containing protein n=1 Tax=Clonostachys byssicola TaxID=160290 RepID=A0A9N9Y4T4_9HYPO|nr:unnamed protein product [Clonostachys byssicola]